MFGWYPMLPENMISSTFDDAAAAYFRDSVRQNDPPIVGRTIGFGRDQQLSNWGSNSAFNRREASANSEECAPDSPFARAVPGAEPTRCCEDQRDAVTMRPKRVYVPAHQKCSITARSYFRVIVERNPRSGPSAAGMLRV